MDSLHSAQADLLWVAVTRCTMLARARISMDAGPLDLLLTPGGNLLRIQGPAVVALMGTLRMEGIPLEFKVRPRHPGGQVRCLMVGQGEAQVCVPLIAWLPQPESAEAPPMVPDGTLRDVLGCLFAALTALRKPVFSPASSPPARNPTLAVARRRPQTKASRVLPR